MASKLKKNHEGRPHYIIDAVLARVMVMNAIYYPASSAGEICRSSGTQRRSWLITRGSLRSV